MMTSGSDTDLLVTEDDVRALARVAGLPLDEGRAATLARLLEADLRVARTLHAVPVGEMPPAYIHPWGSGLSATQS